MKVPSRWLWITAEITDELSTGGLVYSMNLARSVAAQDVDITIVGLGDVVPTSTDLSFAMVPGELRGGWRSLGSHLPNQTFACATDGMRRSVLELLDEQWSTVVFDSLRSAWALDLVVSSHRGTVVFVSQNHDASTRRRIASEVSILQGKRVPLMVDAFKAARLERRVVEASDIVTSITEDDQRLFCADAPQKRHLVLPPGWSGQEAVSRRPIRDRPRRVGILGSFEWHAKQENLRRFLPLADPVFDAAGIELVVGGRCPESFRASLEPDLRATRFMGWVDDKSEFLGDCRIGVIAEPLGGGFKMKSLDYVFNGVPVAALTGAAAGLPLERGVSLIEADDEQQLATEIVAAVDDDAKLQRFADKGREACERKFSWIRCADALIDSVRAADAKRHND